MQTYIEFEKKNVYVNIHIYPEFQTLLGKLNVMITKREAQMIQSQHGYRNAITQKQFYNRTKVRTTRTVKISCPIQDMHIGSLFPKAVNETAILKFLGFF